MKTLNAFLFDFSSIIRLPADSKALEYEYRVKTTALGT
jgi:hypothetical protein